MSNEIGTEILHRPNVQSEEEQSTTKEGPLTSKEEPLTSPEESFVISREKPSTFVEEPLTSREELSISEEKLSILKEEPSISEKEPSILEEKPSIPEKEPSISSEISAASTSCSTEQNGKNLESTSSATAFPSTNNEEIDEDDVIRALNEEYKKVKANPPLEYTLQSKCNEVCERKLNFCESLIEEGDVLLAMTFFTKCIAYAEDGRKYLGLGYCLRAVSLYQLQAYDLAMEDADRAIAADSSWIPDMKKLKRKCLKKKKMALAEGVTLQPKRIPGQIFLGDVLQTANAPISRAEDVSETEWRNLCQFDNASIPNASSKIGFGYDKSKLKEYLEATEDLKAGEIVASQKCFALYVNDYALWQECCSYCMELNQILIPCQTCPYVMYCSIECRDAAFKSYHRLECKIMTAMFFDSDEENTFRLIRQLLICTEQGARLADLMRRMSVRELMTMKLPVSQTFVDDYAAFLQPEKTLLPHQQKEFAPTVAKIILMLERVGFFDGDSSFRPDTEHPDTLSKAQVFTAFLLFVALTKHLKALGPQSINEEMREQWLIGYGCCSLYSAFNHSCDPNIKFLFRNREFVAFATRPIKKGEELVRTCDTQKKLRLAELPRFFKQHDLEAFICQCALCACDCPSDKDGYKKLRELQFYNHIKQKRAKQELKTLVVQLAYEQHFKKLPTKEILHIILNVCEWLFTNMKPPSDLHSDIQHLVFVFMSLLYDQFNSVCSTENHVQFAYDFLLNVVHFCTSTFATAAEGKKKKPRQVIL